MGDIGRVYECSVVSVSSGQVGNGHYVSGILHIDTRLETIYTRPGD